MLEVGGGGGRGNGLAAIVTSPRRQGNMGPEAHLIFFFFFFGCAGLAAFVYLQLRGVDCLILN